MTEDADNSGSKVYVGPAGWHYDDWKGIVYSEPMSRQAKPLALICRLFDMVEINVTFYRAINPRLCVGWLEQTAANPRFLFSAKVPGALTHERGVHPDGEGARTFRSSVEPLRDAGKLGAILAQFPWSFRRTAVNRTYLVRLVDLFQDMPLVVEMRHRSWDCPELLEGLRARGVAFCNMDQPGLEDCLGPTAYVTAPFAYVRLHGRNQAHWFRAGSGRNARYDYLYSLEELKPWIEKILAMGQQVNRLFVVTNNHYRGQAVVNALEIQKSLGVLRGALPESLRYCYPRLDNP